MIVKIFKPAATFSGVRYNTRKVDGNRGQLMKVANFGPLQAFGHLKPHDYINYLSSLAALNKNVRLPQFHAVISAKGKSYDKDTLTGIATSWLKEMGYGDQPYLIVFHHDTDNNHVHMVSSRVDRQGDKITSAFEGKRAQAAMSNILGYDYGMQYSFSTKAQFFMILESCGFPGRDPDESRLKARIDGYVPNRKRAEELKCLLTDYKNVPEFRDELKARFGLDLIFHSTEGKKPYGYSIIDHREKIVFKGSEVLPLRELLSDGVKISAVETAPAEKKTGPVADFIGQVAIAYDVDDAKVHGLRRSRRKKNSSFKR
ncbi:relaxase/mobilization nuclease domain-containing protein [Mucilaginibacter sp. HD30]